MEKLGHFVDGSVEFLNIRRVYLAHGRGPLSPPFLVYSFWYLHVYLEYHRLQENFRPVSHEKKSGVLYLSTTYVQLSQGGLWEKEAHFLFYFYLAFFWK